MTNECQKSTSASVKKCSCSPPITLVVALKLRPVRPGLLSSARQTALLLKGHLHLHERSLQEPLPIFAKLQVCHFNDCRNPSQPLKGAAQTTGSSTNEIFNPPFELPTKPLLSGQYPLYSVGNGFPSRISRKISIEVRKAFGHRCAMA